MLHATINEMILSKQFANQIRVMGLNSYLVSGVRVENLQGDMESLNNLLVDEIISDYGYMLGDLSFKFESVSSDGTATIRVTAGDTEDFVNEMTLAVDSE